MFERDGEDTSKEASRNRDRSLRHARYGVVVPVVVPPALVRFRSSVLAVAGFYGLVPG